MSIESSYILCQSKDFKKFFELLTYGSQQNVYVSAECIVHKSNKCYKNKKENKTTDFRIPYNTEI